MLIMTKKWTDVQSWYIVLYTYHLSFYDIKYKTLGHTHYRIVTEVEKGKYTPYKKGMQSESILSLNLSSIHHEI